MRSVVVLPTFEEAGTIEQVLRRIRLAVPNADVLVVDDGSSDGTAALAQGAAATLGNITVFERSRKAGIGSAYRYATTSCRETQSSSCGPGVSASAL